MMDFIRQRARSFRYAFAGWGHILSTQRNSWIHAVTSSLVLSLAVLLSLPARDIAVLTLTIALVWVAESLNTAIEAVVDLASPQLHPLAKVSKDVGAAAVLMAALASVIIGLLLLGPPLWAVIGP